ncbi:MAG: AAA family ATPase, partial [Clostridiales bacterium]
MRISDLNISDYNDVDIARGMFDQISSDEWEEYLSYAYDNKLFSYDEKAFLGQMKFKARRGKQLSAKQIFLSLRLIEKMNDCIELKEQSREVESAMENNLFNPPIKNITFRVAWHDSGWNGHICKDPQANKFCSGFHSLLSDRIRKRKYKNINDEINYKGKCLNKIDYLPPCFWSINLFGNEKLKVEHDNPAASNLTKIKEELPANSIFSWPFAISFTRSKQEVERDGSYPANLESVRIPFFNAKIKKEKSIGFIYSNYSNPFTEEEGKYLLIGCGFIADIGDLHPFKPDEEIKKIKAKKKKLSNFPKTNWAIRYSFNALESMVNMPYHEYIAYCKKNNSSEEEKEKILNSVKVSITEPELEHCFKYVAMDIDNDEAIFLLSKMKKKLLEIQYTGIVSPADINERIYKVDALLSHCWNVRGHFPGFENLCRAILNFKMTKFPLADLLQKLKSTEVDYIEKLEQLFEDSYADKNYRSFTKYITEITDKLEGGFGITNQQFFQLSMLNLSQFQFERILNGNIADPINITHTVKSICDNPYLLFEDYKQVDVNISESTGDIFDNFIELFKIDVAYYPDINFAEKIKLQSNFKYSDKRRVRALIIRHLNTLENTGDCFDDAASIEKALKEYPLFYKAGDDYVLPTDFLLAATNDYLIHLEEKLKVISANDSRYFYLLSIYECEKSIEKAFQTLLDKPINTKTYSNLATHLDKSVKKLSASMHEKFDKQTFIHERTKLYTNIFEKKLFILAGNPGSGKSYELLNVIKDIEAQKETYILLAPTGKAALRLKNDTDIKGIEASTIDKLIADINTGKRTKASVFNTNNIIID